MSTIVERQFAENTGPRQTNGFVLPATASGGAQDVRLVGNLVPNLGTASGTQFVGMQGQFVDIQNDGTVNLYAALSPSAALVNPAASGVATTSSGGAVAIVYMIPPSSTMSGVYLKPGVDNFICWTTAAGTSTIRVFQTSDFG